MTLTEYCGQSERCTPGSVYLNESEYRVTAKIPGLWLIHLLAFNYLYVLKTGKYDRDCLWTMDEHGNPKAMSVFAIDTSLLNKTI